MGLVIAVFTFFAVIYMSDNPPEVIEFNVASVENDWSADAGYSSGDYVKIDDSYFLCLSDHSSPSPSPTEKSSSPTWEKVNGVPHDNDNIEGSLISVLEKKASTEDFRIKVRSEAFWVENN
jgi:hypothetical protein